MDGLDLLLPPSDSRPRGVSTQEAPPGLARARRRRPRQRIGKFLWFFLVVLLPTALAGVYLFGIASEQYVSEARFVVRGVSQQTPGLLSTILQTAGGARAQDDAYAVQDYMLSRDALNELVSKEGLREVFDRPEADFLSRFPNFLFDDKFEHLYRHYLRHVDVRTDTTTGVSELLFTTYRPEDAQRIARALLAAGERLVNRMNERERENTLKDARREVQVAEGRVQGVSSRIADFRNREALLDPNRQSVPMLQTITALQTRLSSLRLEMSTMQPNSPLLAGARQRAGALQVQIDAERAKITGSDSSLVPKIREFDQLTLELEFANKQLASAITSLETARINADRQQVYLDEVVAPNAPDYALYPKRFVSLGIVFATALSMYITASLLIAGAREHRLV